MQDPASKRRLCFQALSRNPHHLGPLHPPDHLLSSQLNAEGASLSLLRRHFHPSRRHHHLRPRFLHC